MIAKVHTSRNSQYILAFIMAQYIRLFLKFVTQFCLPKVIIIGQFKMFSDSETIYLDENLPASIIIRTPETE
jgi:hypothetical protein